MKTTSVLSLLLSSMFANTGEIPDAIVHNPAFDTALVVQIHSGEGEDLIRFHRHGARVVQGLTDSKDQVIQARTMLHAKSLYGPITVRRLSSGRLPYADNLVNAIVSEDLGNIAELELMRVLAPGGIAIVNEDGQWRTLVKPEPTEADDWTHYLHNADGNAVSRDTRILPPRRLQWSEDPTWSRSHEHTPSVSAMVSCGGKIFYLFDEGIAGIYDPRLPERWYLHARDAYNGVLLWKTPMSGFGSQEWKSKGNWGLPIALPRRLVAVDNRIYATLSYRGRVTVIDAKDGRIVRALEGTENTEEILYQDGMLILRTMKNIPDYSRKAHAWRVQASPNNRQILYRAEPGDERILAVDPETGEQLWKVEEKRLATLTLAASADYVCYHTFEEIVCLDRKTGKENWRKKNASWPDYVGTTGTLLIYNGVVYYASDRGLHAWHIQTGELLWKGLRIARTGIRHTADLFIADGVLWSGFTPDMKTGRIPEEVSPFAERAMRGKKVQGLDPRTGEVVKELNIGELVSDGHHVRCYRGKATDRFLMWSKRGIDFVSLRRNQKHDRVDWVRGECSYGIMPANGLLYVPPHPCVCYSGVLLNGFNALTGEANIPAIKQGGPRLVKGPAYETDEATSRLPTASSLPSSFDWPTYRHDIMRSGATKTRVPSDLTKRWECRIGGRLTSPVVADGRLFVASCDAHTLHALDAAKGTNGWHFIAGGRIDSPPTVYAGYVLFGSHDGWAYCLRAADGQLAWKYRAAPTDRTIMVRGQLESVWPVPGNVLVKNGVAYFSVGRSSFLDGGIRLCALNAESGEPLHEIKLDGPWPDLSEDEGDCYGMDGAKSDILVSCRSTIHLGFNSFDDQLAPQPLTDPDKDGKRPVAKHLMPGNGFLDHTWYDRVAWSYDTTWQGRFYKWDRQPRSGQLLVFDDACTYALKGYPQKTFMSPKFTPGEGYQLRADTNEVLAPKDYEKGKRWAVPSNVRAYGLVLAGETLFLAGSEDRIPEDDPYRALDGRDGAVLQAVSTADGAVQRTLKLDAPPVFDGMIAAQSRLYIAVTDGKVLCYSAP